MDFRRAPRSLLEAGALAGGLAVLLHWAAFELGRGAFGPGSGLPAVIAGLGLLSTGLGTLSVAVGPLSRTEGRLLGGALLAVLGFLTDSSWLGTLAALAAVVTLWAFRTPYPRNEPTTESPGRETEAHS